MKILILGGTLFVGRHLVEAALARGHEVTLFNRGREAPGLYPEVERLTGDRRGDLSALHGRRWDAAVDTAAYVPSIVQRAARLLAPSIERYLFVSTRSVYADHADSEKGGRLAVTSDEGVREAEEIVPGGRSNARLYGERYGALKARCERAAEEEMPGRVLSIRPGLIVGPFDPTDRFTYWVRRVARGGDVLAPGRPDRVVRAIDARDLAAWCVRLLEGRAAGTFNASGADGVTMASMLEACRPGGSAAARFVWASEALLVAEGVTPWSELPLWVLEEDSAFLETGNARAVAAGLRFRPLAETGAGHARLGSHPAGRAPDRRALSGAGGRALLCSPPEPSGAVVDVVGQVPELLQEHVVVGDLLGGSRRSPARARSSGAPSAWRAGGPPGRCAGDRGPLPRGRARTPRSLRAFSIRMRTLLITASNSLALWMLIERVAMLPGGPPERKRGADWPGSRGRIRRDPCAPGRRARRRRPLLFFRHVVRRPHWPGACCTMACCLSCRGGVMINAWWTRGLWLVTTLAATMALPLACGSGHATSSGQNSTSGGTSFSSSGTGGNQGLGGNFGSTSDLVSIAVTPPTATIECLNGAPASQAFVATGHFKDGTTQDITATVTWSAPGLQIGAIDATGLYSASGSIGGLVAVTASYKGVTASAALTVKLTITSNTAMAPAPVQTALQGATTPDATVVWAYPYDGTVWPRGLLPPILQWNGGAAADLYYVHFQSGTFELQGDYGSCHQRPPPPARLARPHHVAAAGRLHQRQDPAHRGPLGRRRGHAHRLAHLDHRARLDARHHLLLVQHNDLGRVLRIKPGAAKADDFANQAPLNDPSKYPQSIAA